jgi:hypothetical protein
VIGRAQLDWVASRWIELGWAGLPVRCKVRWARVGRWQCVVVDRAGFGCL